MDATFEMIDRDVEVGGGIIARALAYRMFIWMLPFALVVVAGLGIASSASSTSPADAAGAVGLAGLVSSSVASAAKSSSRWYALVVGVPTLFLAARSVLLSTLVVAVPYAGAWLLISIHLPHRDAGWRELLPGAALFGIGVDLLQIGAAHALAPMALSKQGPTARSE